MPRTYVNNASNRSLGRVGMAHGSMVVSSSGGGSSGGSRSYTSASSSSDRCYVDNSSNRSLGRVGLPLGSAVHSTSGASGSGSHSSSSSRTYVDNPANRSLGRVGLPLGAAVHSSSGASGSGSHSSSSSRTYVDNPSNRALRRVGLEVGTAVQSSSSTSNIGYSGGRANSKPRTYVDNPMNRKLGRVGKIVGTAVVSSSQNNRSCAYEPIDVVFRPLQRIDAEDQNLEAVLAGLNALRNDFREGHANADPVRENHCQAAIGIVHRHEAAISRYRSGLQTPEWVRGGEVIHFPEIQLGQKIGSGGFGDVFVGVWKSTQQVAIKMLRVQRVSQAKKEEFQKEVKVYSSLNHPAIVKFYGVCITPPNLAIVMEFMAAGSLYDCLHVETREFTIQQKHQMVSDCLSALRYLHGRNITHRDIKSMNIMVCDDFNHCKLGDFGLALKEEVRATASVADHSVVGTLCYSPPEVIDGSRLTQEQLKSADIYSMTVVIVEFLTRKRPYSGMNQHQVRRAISTGISPLSSSHVLRADLGALLKNGLARMSSERPTAELFLLSWDTISLTEGLEQLRLNTGNGNSDRTPASILPTVRESGHEGVLNRSLRSNAAVDRTTPRVTSSSSNRSSASTGRLRCPICMVNERELVFRCGHSVCDSCLPQLQHCPVCRGPTNDPIRLFI